MKYTVETRGDLYEFDDRADALLFAEMVATHSTQYASCFIIVESEEEEE